MRLLVYTPTMLDGPLAACGESIRGQRYDGGWEWVVDDDDPFPPPDHRNVLAKYQRARQMALAGGYDALVTVEHDMILPADALQKLADAGKPVVYGVYVLRHGSAVLNAWRREGERNLGMSLTLFPDELQQAMRAELYPVSGCGWGCTLIRRAVLERIPFHDAQGRNPAGDLIFATDCLRAGIEAWAHFGVLCGHIEGDAVLWPLRNGGEPVKYLALATVNAVVDGVLVHLAAGQEFEAATEPTDLLRAGYVRHALDYEAPEEVAVDVGAVTAEKAVKRGRKKA